MLKLLLLFLALTTQLALPVLAQQRVVQSINSNWQFRKADGQDYTKTPAPAAGWAKVSLPHTWNTADVLDDQPGYYRGVGWYRKTVFAPAAWKGQSVYLQFDGANQETEVYVNGQLAGKHAGGYTAFRFPVSKLLKFNANVAAANEVLVKVDNSHNPSIPPLSADFTFYGGIYRDVHLLAASPVHFDLENYASPGTFVTTPAVSAEAAEVVVNGTVANDAAIARKVTVLSRLLDHQGRTVGQQRTSLRLGPRQKQPFRLVFGKLNRPHLWSPDDPYLYRVVSSIEDGKKPLDEVSSPLGMRWFRFDAATGFFLNGQPMKLVGTNRHQDFQGLGNALPDALHERDILLLKQMGGNFLRISHYPQDPTVLAACDRLGILASIEIPIVNEITDSPAFFETCKYMQTEMIRQNFNHPCLIIWNYMNEILLRMPESTRKDEAARQAYFGRVADLAKQLDDLTRREDPSRYTMIVNNGVFELYHRAGLTKISQLVGWNVYAGWYGNNTKLEDLNKILDRHHQELPTVPLLVTEYGADADPRLHSFEPRRFDKTQEYANLYHQYYLKEFLARPYVVGTNAWNLTDFNSESRQEANPHVNTKSLLTTDRQPKDTYLFYQAHLLKTPFVKIGSRNWTLRSGTAAGADSLFCKQPVEVYTNQPTVRLTLNGHDLGTRPAEFGIVRFRVPFVDGENKLTAQAPGQTSDEATITFQLLPPNLTSEKLPFHELNVSLGDQRYFTDAPLSQVWLPEQAYTPGSWGYVGGRALVQPGSLPYGSGRNILGTEYDAIYETQRVGLSQFRLDVADGQYEVTLHFAELESVPTAEQLIYNLEKPAGPAAPVSQTGRSFDVLLNGQAVLTGLGTATDLQPLQATNFKFPVQASGGQGIRVDFKAAVGEAILNAIQVKRLY
ncbi:glycoside hydrolase family 2 TIM barrel-domain containing protein [Hymenobacter sp. BT770]|uniref:glycoside hydrolase family 2 TIM barrel-domain containing protein n=1 Tax=Hymenobacter sp. BT770 TaxID=2886942 RepID=UPI001D11BAC8|nr:glycoside hydrolase family 2 TIM barrel-domain containing protein [Hymenobacter sp. BT770]MCC3153226.1 beta-galactosidase [Hymenobacter sp. BT770]MDO3414221.1 glycoside hydrolase family 2 TIM barrel-domain containing protein [Hymenobacter sp. BT770]